MELDKQAREAVRNLGAAVNSAIEKSVDVTRAIDAVRRLGYEPHLTLKLEIALQEIGAKPEAASERYDNFSANGGEDDDDDDKETVEAVLNDLDEQIELELTDEDVRTLRRMKIRFE